MLRGGKQPSPFRPRLVGSLGPTTEKSKRYQEYYRDHRLEILARRAAKYRRDKEHREHVRALARQWYADHRGQPKLKTRIKAANASPLRLFLTLEGERVAVRVLPIGAMIAAVGGAWPSTRIVRRLIEQRILPPSAFVQPGGRRLYTMDQALVLRDALAAVAHLPRDTREGVLIANAALKAHARAGMAGLRYGLTEQSIAALLKTARAARAAAGGSGHGRAETG